MRVDNIYKNIEIIVETNGKVIKKFKRNQLFPSEMESILLRKEDLNNMTGNKVSVYIK